MNERTPHDPRFPDTMLLAAGLGTRLRPLTETTPKPLIEVAGIALIDRIIANLRAEGASRFAVNVHHHADQVVAHFGGHRDFFISREDDLLGTGGGVKRAMIRLRSDTILVANTDAFWLPGADFPIARLLQRHATSAADITLLCAHPRRATGFTSRSHDFCLDPQGAITNDFGVPVIYAGVALIEKRLFASTPDGAWPLTRLFDQALAAEKLSGVLLDADWFHVGDPTALQQAQTIITGSGQTP